MKNSFGYSGRLLKTSKIIISISFLQMSPNILNAADNAANYELASFSGNSKIFDEAALTEKVSKSNTKVINDLNRNIVKKDNVNTILDKSKLAVLPLNEGTTISFLVNNDLFINGIFQKNENVHTRATVKLFDKNRNEINVGPDGILGTEDDAPGGVLTNEQGRYTFSKISHDFYRIKVEVE